MGQRASRLTSVNYANRSRKQLGPNKQLLFRWKRGVGKRLFSDNY